MDNHLQRIERLYHQARAKPAAQRSSFLDDACGGDLELRREVESLLDSLDQAGSFMESPALEVAARMTARSQDQPLTGRLLGAYQILSLLGKGGMGEVYLAQDTRLDRQVALKVLPAEVTADPERLRRFVREAKAASALDHPNIATIHELGEAEGIHYIAMEYVKGETLAEHIHGRVPSPGKAYQAFPPLPLPGAREYSPDLRPRPFGGRGWRSAPGEGAAPPLATSEVLAIGVQVAEALEEAHNHGITHRDIKPTNIMLTPRGLVKVLDFGLAKRAHREKPAAETAASTESQTTPGMIMGTVDYMSPEQVLGEEVDHRTDLFSLGVVLYDMTTGQLPFRGMSPTDTIGKILHTQPEAMARFNPDIPVELERIVRKCLEKERALRYQHASELCADLKRLKRDTDSVRSVSVGAEAERASRLQKRRWFWALAGLLALLLAGGGITWYGKRRAESPADAVLTPIPLTSYPGYESTPSFSPDGTQVAFEWCKEGEQGNYDIYIKQIGVEPPFQLTTDPASDQSPAWSPDGNFIAFLRRVSPTKAALVIIPQCGGQERVLGETNLSEIWGPCLAWTPDSKWLAFQDRTGPGLFLLSVQTRERRRLTDMRDDNYPAFSPDGRILAFDRVSEISLLRLAEDYVPQGLPERLTSSDDVGAIAWAPDGSEIIFSNGIWLGSGLWRMAASASASPRKLPLAAEDYGRFPAVSRHGNRLAYRVNRWDSNIWRFEMRKPGLEPGVPVPLISSTQIDGFPAYSPDGRKIAFGSTRSRAREIWICRSDGSNAVQLTTSGGGVPKWSPDGRTIVYRGGDGPNTSVHVISADGGVPKRLTTGPFVDYRATFSRDGQSIYFASNRSRTKQIWKVPAAGGDPVQITPDGEDRDGPQESPDGKFLYYSRGNPFPDRCAVYRMPLGGGEETLVLDSVHCAGNWAFWKEGIYFFRPADAKGHSDICLYEFATGKTSKVLTIEKSIFYHIEASPDGRSILYTQNDQDGSDLMLVENFR